MLPRLCSHPDCTDCRYRIAERAAFDQWAEASLSDPGGYSAETKEAARLYREARTRRRERCGEIGAVGRAKTTTQSGGKAT